MRRPANLLSFPNPVNDTSARLVAGGVAVMALGVLVLRQHWMLVPLTYGFLARVATGPTLSPLAQLVTRVITPRVGGPTKVVPGPPKRFAQAIGAVFTVTASVLYFGFGATLAADIAVALLLGAATLESVFGYCLGCKAFSLLMRSGVIPEDVCEECNDIWSRAAA